MWGRKFSYVFSNSITYPWAHFASIKQLFYSSILAMIGVYAVFALLVFWLFNHHMMGLPYNTFQSNELIAFSEISQWVVLAQLVLSFLVFLCMVPYQIGIIRAIVLGETESQYTVFTGITQPRTWVFVWAHIKIFGMMLLINMPVVMLTFGLLGNGVMDMLTVSHHSQVLHMWQSNGSVTTQVLMLAYVLTLVATLFFVPRWSMASVFASLDRGSSLEESFELTRGNWLLILLSFLAVGISLWIISLVVMFILSVLLTFLILLVPIVGLIALTALMFVGTMYISGVMMAVLGNLYQIISHTQRQESQATN